MSSVYNDELLNVTSVSKNITMPETFWRRLEVLANGNTAGVRSRMLTELAYLAEVMPEEFGINPPSEKKGSHPEVDRRSTGEGLGVRLNVTMLVNDWSVVQRLANPNTKGYKSTLLRHLLKVAYENHARLGLYPPSDVPVLREAYTITDANVPRDKMCRSWT